jgi:hypothetical protein
MALFRPKHLGVELAGVDPLLETAQAPEFTVPWVSLPGGLDAAPPKKCPCPCWRCAPFKELNLYNRELNLNSSFCWQAFWLLGAPVGAPGTRTKPPGNGNGGPGLGSMKKQNGFTWVVLGAIFDLRRL